MNRSNPPLYIFIFLCSVICFAVSGVFVKYSLLPPTATAFYRQLISLLPLPLVWKELRGLTRRDILLMLIGGFMFGFNILMWNYGLILTTQANCNLLANMSIFATVPLSYLLYKEKIRKPFIIGTAIAFVGLVALITGKADPGDGSLTGDVIAFLSALLYGGYLMATYSVRDRMSALCAIEVGSIGTLIALLPTMLILDGPVAPTSWAALWPILLIMLFGQFGGMGLTSLALGRIRATTASILALTQPAFGAILGLLLFHEVLTWQEIAGILIISLGVFIAQKSKQEQLPAKQTGQAA